MRKRRAASGSGRPDGPLITRASGGGRRLFTRRPSRLAAFLIWAGVVVGAACLIETVATDRDPVAAFAFACAVVVGVALVCGFLVRMLASRA